MRTGLVTLLMLVGGFALFLHERHVLGTGIETARTVVVNVIVVVEIFYLLNCRSLLHAPWTIGFWSNRWVFVGIAAMLVAQLLFTHLPLMNHLFHSAPLDAAAWLRVVGVGIVAFVIVEVEKWIRLRAGADDGAGARREPANQN